MIILDSIYDSPQLSESSAGLVMGIILAVCAIAVLLIIFYKPLRRKIGRKSVAAECTGLIAVHGRMDNSGLREKVASGNVGVSVNSVKASFSIDGKEQSFILTEEQAQGISAGTSGILSYAGKEFISFIAKER